MGMGVQTKTFILELCTDKYARYTGYLVLLSFDLAIQAFCVAVFVVMISLDDVIL